MKNDHQPLLAFPPNETDKTDETTKTTALQTCSNIFRANIGSGILGLPFAFQEGGLAASIIGVVTVCALSLYCSKLLIDCKKEVPSAKTYGDIGTHCFGVCGSAIVNAALVFTQLGFCIAYVIFIGQNLHLICDALPVFAWILLISPILYGLVCIPSLRILSPLTMFANITFLAALVIIVQISARHIEGPDIDYIYTDVSGVLKFLGAAIYCYEGIGVVIPIRESMKNPNHFMPILCGTISLISGILIGFATVTYLAFGADTNSIITANIPFSWITVTGQFFLCFTLLISFPIQMVPVLEIVEPPNPYPAAYFIVRFSLCSIVILLAIFIPNFGLFIGLVGSLGSCFLAFIIPVAFHLRLTTLSTLLITKDILILILGGSVSVLSTIVTIRSLVM